MPLISSHLVNLVDGTHAAQVKVKLYKIENNGRRCKILETETDSGGRFQEKLNSISDDSTLEIVFHIASYFRSRGILNVSDRIVQKAVVRFKMVESVERYHFPVMIAPNGYSVWWPS